VKIFLVHPRRGENRPQAAYARREDLPIHSTANDEIVELDVSIDIRDLRAALANLDQVMNDHIIETAFQRETYEAARARLGVAFYKLVGGPL
jgi:hypothetical protein